MWTFKLSDALKACDATKFEELVKYGHKELNEINYSPLMEAVRMGGHHMVDLLLHAGSKGDEINLQVNGRTPLMLACENGDLEMCRILLRFGADVNAIRIHTSMPVTPLYIAAKQGHYEPSGQKTSR